MRRLVFELLTASQRCLAAAGFVLVVGGLATIAASTGVSAQDQQKQPPGQAGAPNPADAARDQRRTDEFVEAAQVINGPAGNPECVWLGRRVVVLMWRDDLDTAFRHLDLYDRFGCPGGHVQATFRCLVKFGAIDPKTPDSLSGRVHTCWINPNAQPQQAAAQNSSPPAGGAAQPAAPAAAPPADK